MEIIISNYSKYPRYFTINGTRYDIDNPYDILRIPLFRTLIEWNGVQYGMDTILLEHALEAQNTNLSVYHAAIDKVNEYRSNGIVFKSDRELEQERIWNENRIKREQIELLRKKQCDSFTIDDMRQFSDIPFGWHWVDSLRHTNGKAWFMLNMNNQAVALQYISQLDELLADGSDYIEGISNCRIDLQSIDFDFPVPLHKDSLPNTRVECEPYTPSGKFSKYPAILRFASSETHHLRNGYSYQTHPVLGEIHIMRDGNIGSATVEFLGGSIFRFRLFGLSLVIKSVDINYQRVFNFDQLKF